MAERDINMSKQLGLEQVETVERSGGQLQLVPNRWCTVAESMSAKLG